ncbi:MAG: VWA domain-containing protein [Acidobacteriota bacterium]|nr:VWA domain-containing protein [Acidobacteriota bacterium]
MAENFGLTFRSLPLLALVAIGPIAIIFLIARERHRIRVARRFVSENLRGIANPLRPMRPYLIGLGLLAAAIALAGPRAGFTRVPIQARESNRVIAIDVSDSMGATDIGASRLNAAKAIAKRIIESDNGRVALVIFESRAEVVAPLTNDDEAVAALIDSIQTGEVADPGTDLGGALFGGMRLVESDPAQKGDVIIISDGEDQGTRLEEALKRAREKGVVVSTIVVGSTTGSTIHRADGGDLRDDNGDVVRTYAHPEVLQQIARSTGGRFYTNPFGEHDLDSLAGPPSSKGRDKNVKIPIERFQWPLALAAFAILLGSFTNRGAE